MNPIQLTVYNLLYNQQTEVKPKNSIQDLGQEVETKSQKEDEIFR